MEKEAYGKLFDQLIGNDPQVKGELGEEGKTLQCGGCQWRKWWIQGLTIAVAHSKLDRQKY